MTTDLVIDHLRLLKVPRYYAKMQARLRDLVQRHGDLSPITVVHEADRRCCRRESWAVTSSRLWATILAEINRRNPADVAAVLREHEPSVVIATHGGRR